MFKSIFERIRLVKGAIFLYNFIRLFLLNITLGERIVIGKHFFTGSYTSASPAVANHWPFYITLGITFLVYFVIIVVFLMIYDFYKVDCFFVDKIKRDGLDAFENIPQRKQGFVLKLVKFVIERHGVSKVPGTLFFLEPLVFAIYFRDPKHNFSQKILTWVYLLFSITFTVVLWSTVAFLAGWLFLVFKNLFFLMSFGF